MDKIIYMRIGPKKTMVEHKKQIKEVATQNLEWQFGV